MRAKLVIVAIAVLALCGLASAQNYFIQTDATINLRSRYSTDSRIVETVPSGTTLQVVGKVNRWLKINRNGSEVWMADWVPYTRLAADLGNPPEQHPLQPAEIDNLCFTVRTCRTDEEWTAGYYAFQEQQGGRVLPAVNQNHISAPSGETATVVHIVDGDTIDVRLHGQTVRVRYIGVNTPERGEACYAEATNHNQVLVQGKTVTLVRDTSDTDRYGRLLRYIYADGLFVNLSLVQDGYAEAKYYAPDGRHRQTFEAAQQAAPQRGCTSAPAPPPAEIDNLCFTVRTCHTPEEWAAGYYAFQEQPRTQPQVAYVENCTHARQLGIAPVYRGHPAYRRALDRDNDGIGCE